MEKKDKKVKVAVYGSLRRGLGNHRLLADKIYIGQFETEPIYDLYDLGSYPGLKLNGNTAVLMEVYEVTQEYLETRLDSLEGYYDKTGSTNTSNLYNRVEIDSPFGTVYTYLYNWNPRDQILVESGNWLDYHRNKIIKSHGFSLIETE